MRGIVPLLAAFLVYLFHFLQCGKGVGILFDELHVGMAAFLYGGDVLSREVPYLVQYLRLETTEG